MYPTSALRIACLAAALLWLSSAAETVFAAGNGTNFLLITVDDMNCDSVGVYGCEVKGITPHIDKLAGQGLRFAHAHVTIAVCQPTRAVWMTGRYPHRNGAEGFEKINQGVPTLLEQFKQHGYYTGIMAKVPHVVPSRGRAWDMSVGAGQLKTGREPELYHQHAARFFEQAKQADKPFFLMANSQDPHRPFAGSKQEQGRRKRSSFPDVKDPYAPDEVPVPGFLPNLPDVRQEMSEYYTSVRRADEITGAVLKALDESGLADNTLVMFLSDHGMPLPFAKTNCYYHSTRTPWIVRWPGKIKPGTVDQKHSVSGIDLAPTVLDALGLPPLEGMDGRSFLPVLGGNPQEGRDVVFTHFHRTAGRKDYPMRSVVGKRFGYIFSPWSDGKTVFRNESQSGLTMRAMQRAAQNDPDIAARVKLFLYRVPEEFYDYQKDPDALNNLIDDPQYQDEIRAYRQRLLEHLKQTKDPLLKTFQKRLAQP